MAANRKLTGLLKGRTVQQTETEDGKLRIHFEGGSVMTIKTGGAVSGDPTGQTVAGVRQSGTAFSLDFDGGESLDIATAEATSSVMVRDKSHVMEYAD